MGFSPWRTSQNNGKLILTFPYSKEIKKSIENTKITNSKDREKYFGQHDHVRIYSEKDILLKLKKCGFKVRSINLSNEFGPKFGSRFALIQNEKIFICSKRK